MEPKVEQVSSNCLTLGEGPHWDAEKQVLYYVDIFGKYIYKYDPSTGRETKAKTNGTVGFIVPVKGKTDHFVVGIGLKFVMVKWDGESENVDIVETVGEAKLGDRINDGKADPNGRLFGGTMGKEEPLGKVELNASALYTVDKTGARAVAENISLSNGLAWNIKKKIMYYIDSLDYSVYCYDYNSSNGDMDNRRVVINFKECGIDAIPDGMTIDTDGNLWIACFNGSRVIKVDPNNGKILQTVMIPAKQITSVTFGGKDLDQLYVTSATLKLTETLHPPNGALFVIKNLGVKGYAGTSCRL